MTSARMREAKVIMRGLVDADDDKGHVVVGWLLAGPPHLFGLQGGDDLLGCAGGGLLEDFTGLGIAKGISLFVEQLGEAVAHQQQGVPRRHLDLALAVDIVEAPQRRPFDGKLFHPSPICPV